MLDSYALYSTELTDEERELGFELIDVQNPSAHFANQRPVHVVAYRFTETDQIVKMNVPVIGGNSYRHERLRGGALSGSGEWAPVGSIVFPTAEMAVDSVGSRNQRLQMCH